MVLTLRPRMENEQGLPGWHDVIRFQLALDGIIAGKPLARVGVWLGLARKLQVAQAEAGWPTQVNVEVEIEFEEGEAKLFWEELQRIPPETLKRNRFTGQPEVPDAATLGEMLEDWGKQLGMDS